MFITIKTRIMRLFLLCQSQYWIYSNVLTRFHSIKIENLDLHKQLQMVGWKKFPVVSGYSLSKSELKIQPKFVPNSISVFLKKHLNLTNSTRITFHMTLHIHVMHPLVNELSTILQWCKHTTSRRFWSYPGLHISYFTIYVEQAC